MKKLLIALLVCAGLASAQGIRVKTATIAKDASLSSAVNIDHCSPIRIIVPTIDSASLTLQHSDDGTAYANVYDKAGNEVTLVTATGARVVILNPNDYFNMKYLKIRSGTASSPVNQTTAAVTFSVVCQMVVN